MDLGLVKKTNRSWVVLLAAAFSSYAAYKVYNSPSLSRKRTRFLQLLRAFSSMADAISHSAETISLVSKELKLFLQSESDQLPNSLNQMAKLARSDEFSQSVVVITKALTIGILSAHQSNSNSGSNPGFLEKVIDKLSTPSGCGFVSSIAGSFARNLVKAYYDCSSKQGISSSSGSELMELICSPKSKSLIADCTQMFVSTAVTVYLEKTLHINPYNQLFAGLTDPKHEKQVKDLVISVSNSAITTLVKSSHSVLTCPEDYPDKPSKQRKRKWEGGGGDWVGKVSSTLAVPSNRKLVVDVTGKVTFETVRSVLEFVVERVRDGVKECVEVVEEVVVEGGFEAVSYVTAKSFAVTDLCLSAFLDVLDSATWILIPA